jgi:hypothetical protein
MTLLGRLLLALALAAILASIWIQAYWGQLLMTALILFLTGAVLIGGTQRSNR